MSRTLLLADDSVVIQKLVGLSFANEDVEIVATDNGDDAVARARETCPDVILADVVMPGKSGYEVCEELKRDPALAHVPILLLTGTFEAFDENRANAVGANGHITKPFEAQALVERVKEVMASAAAPTAATPTAPPTAPAADDFFDDGVTTLAPDPAHAELLETTTVDEASATLDVTPSIPATEVGPRADSPLFGAPGEGAAPDLEPVAGNLSLGESVAMPSTGAATATESGGPLAAPLTDDDATIAVLPDPPPPLPPSSGDPIVGFEDDYGLNELPPVPPPAVADLDSALDAAPPDPAATILVGTDDRNSATSPDLDHESGAGDPDLTVHTPSAAVDSAATMAQSPPAFETAAPPDPPAAATVVADLDISLSEAPPATPPPAPEPLDLGPSSLSPDELDFAFDVSEQAPATAMDPGDAYGDSFSSLMDISESQILGAAISETEPPPPPPTDGGPQASEALAAGYDVSSSDLATTFSPPGPATPPPPPATAAAESPAVPEPPAESPVTAARPEPDIATADSGADLDLAAAPAAAEGDQRIANLSPMMEQRIQETLEKVAWEAFSDLSESIVKQVIDRVEKIAWEAIPQMAETLVREEIRKMKGEDD